MTQPTSVDMTFDTSLVDLKPNTSFSTTESDPSDFGASNLTSNPAPRTPALHQASPFEEQSQKTPKPSQALQATVPYSVEESAEEKDKARKMEVQHLPTQDAYDQWASIYDSDGNMLQSIDDLELATLLPDFLSSVLRHVPSSHISVLDLGCGTGRNTAKLAFHTWPLDRHVRVTGLDFSHGMLDVAARKLRPRADRHDGTLELRLEHCDCFPTVSDPSASPLPSVQDLAPVDAVVSTLVLEHVPLTPYFSTLASLLQHNGVALITNMHADMGRVSQAGFINAEGVKVRGSSFAHTVQDTVHAARQFGFEVVSVKERAMTKGDVEGGMVGERGWKWVGVKVWYGLVLRKIV